MKRNNASQVHATISVSETPAAGAVLYCFYIQCVSPLLKAIDQLPKTVRNSTIRQHTYKEKLN